MSEYKFVNAVLGPSEWINEHGSSRRGILNGYKGAIFKTPDGKKMCVRADQIFDALGLENKKDKTGVYPAWKSELETALLAIMKADIVKANTHSDQRWSRTVQIEWWLLCKEEGVEIPENMKPLLKEMWP